MPDDIAAKTMLGAFTRIQTPAGASAAAAARTLSPPVVLGLLRLADVLLVLAAGLIAWEIDAESVGRELLWPMLALVGLAMANALHLLGAYRLDAVERPNAALGHVLAAALITAVAAVAVLALADELNDEIQTWLLLWFIVGLLALACLRVGLSFKLMQWRRSGQLSLTVAVVGAGAIGQKLLRHISTRAAGQVRVHGIYDDRLARLPGSCLGFPIRGNVDQLVADAREQPIDRVILALPLSADRRLAEIADKLRGAAVDVVVCPDLFGFQLGDSAGSTVGGMPLLGVSERPLRDWRRIAKEIEDRLLGVMILTLIAPVLLSIAILIKLDSPGPVFFRQRRYGLNNRLIEVLKFRTMHQHATDANAEQLTRRNDPRVTRLGAFLRRTSLDELPQFINVVRGEMSIVGPRPHALAAKAGGLLYQEAVRDYDARCRMKPGITGWAQVNGWRGETSTIEQIRKRVEHDLYYIDHWSVPLDLLIILRTALGGFTGRSAY
jgi:Undecaprenyl-phosphate glucose phosphotransferase